MGIGPFAYLPFFVALFKINGHSYEMRSQGHMVLGPVCYAFMLVNHLLLGDGWLVMDAILFLTASYFFYLACSDNLNRVSHGGIGVIAVAGALIAWSAWPTGPSAAQAEAERIQQERLEASMKKMLSGDGDARTAALSELKQLATDAAGNGHSEAAEALKQIAGFQENGSRALDDLGGPSRKGPARAPH